MSVITNAQTCGFGCLGLSGFYGGYSFQNYEPTGLNDHLSKLAQQFTSSQDEIKFNRGKGFRIGANIFRAKFSKYFLTAKGFYQFLKEEQTVSTSAGNENSFKSVLELNHWGLGLDFGIPLARFLNWKIIEGGVTFYTTDLSNELNASDQEATENKFEHGDVNVGYYVATGLIIHIIKDYISIEGTAAYNQVTIEDLVDGDGNLLLGDNSSSSILDKGNFSATIQLNIGVPL